MKAQHALQVIEVALEHARTLGCPPMTVAVLDVGGHLVAFHREDGSSLYRERIARGKAAGALGMGVGSRSLAKVAGDRPAFIDAVVTATQGGLVPAPGGVLVRDSEGGILGAVGVSGHLPDVDEECAVVGIEAAGLSADPGV